MDRFWRIALIEAYTIESSETRVPAQTETGYGAGHSRTVPLVSGSVKMSAAPIRKNAELSASP